MEEARLQLDEPAVQTGQPLKRDALDFGLGIQALLHLGRLHESRAKPSEALSLYRLALGYAARMKPGYESRQMFTALWPDQKADKGAVVVNPDNAATLVADAHLRAGKLLSAMGQGNEALAHFRSAAMMGPMRMAGVPNIGNARGDTNFAGIAGTPAAKAQFYLAKELIAKGDAQGASQVLYEAGRNLPDHLRPELNELNMAIARMYSSQPRDPSVGMDQEQRQYAERQRQQDFERNRAALRQMAPRAKVVQELVGTWDLVPDNKYLPRQQTLRVEADASFTLTLKQDGRTRRGKMDVRTGRDPVRGRTDPSRGQMTLLEESGEIGTMWYEFIDRDRMQVTDLEGTKYEARRQ